MLSPLPECALFQARSFPSLPSKILLVLQSLGQVLFFSLKLALITYGRINHSSCIASREYYGTVLLFGRKSVVFEF